MAKPVARVAMTSEWSPKMDRAWAARERAATWITTGESSPAILYMLGIISNNPWEAVNVVVSAPACTAPWTVPEAPPSLCISMISGMPPQMFFFPWADHSSENSPMGEAGVMG